MVIVDGDKVLIPQKHALKLARLTQRKLVNRADGIYYSCTPTLRALTEIAEVIPKEEIDVHVWEWLWAKQDEDKRREENAHLRNNRELIDVSRVEQMPFGKTKPMKHQKQAIELMGRLPNYALLADVGTGKTFTLIHHACQAFRCGEITQLIVFAPNNVKFNYVHPDASPFNQDSAFVDEIYTHAPPDVPIYKFVYDAGISGFAKRVKKYFASLEQKNRLHIAVFNYESASSAKAQELLYRMAKTAPTMLALDESTRVKNPKAERTRALLQFSKYCTHRVIMTGTPLVKRPEDAFAQLSMLGPDEMPFDNFTAFKRKFCVMGSQNFGNRAVQTIQGYKDLEELQHIIDRVSFRVMKEECLDLPDRVYEKRWIEMTKEQCALYEEMRTKAVAKIEENEWNATIALVQMLRLAQIANGFLPHLDENGEPTGEVVPVMPADKNPKFLAALELLEDSEDKFIIWGNWTAQIRLMSSLLDRHKIDHVLFYGPVSPEERVAARERFQNDPNCRVLLGNPAAGGIGLTLTAAGSTIYLSNSFKTEERLQSEGRNHRKGSEIHKTINYYDLVAFGTVEERVLEVLRNNKRLSDMIMRENYKEWI